MTRNLVWLLAIAAVSCGQTGREEVSYPIVAFGTAPAAFQSGDWQVTLTVATVGFGPAYFCATASASADLCPAAVAEFTDAKAVDALFPDAQPLGMVHGLTGEARSATYDYAITWFTTQLAPSPLAAAPGSHAAHFEGTAVKGEQTLRFVCDVDVAPLYQGTHTVQGARIESDVVDANVRLEVRFDPNAWWRGVDFDELAALSGDPVIVPRTARAQSAVQLAMTANAGPSFTWIAQ